MEPLKYLYNRSFIERTIADIQQHYSPFDGQQFNHLVFDAEWDARELKPRMRHITHCLHQILELPYPKTLSIFKKSIKEREGEALEKMFYPDYVEVYGMEDIENSLDALEAFTAYASAEFAIRPFIVRYESTTMQRLMEWTKHGNHHIRRLASEGCRPRLPWAMALPRFKRDSAMILPILEQLKDDPSEYVRRSVANNWNDIAKDHPDMVLKMANRWLSEDSPYPENRRKLVKHALRTLLKQGNTEALMLFGFGNPKDIEVNKLVLNKDTIKIGDDLLFNFEIHNTSAAAAFLRLEYGIDFVKKTGKTSRKVFKITENTYPSGSTTIKRKQSFKDLTTRKHYSGRHQLSIIINGVEKTAQYFDVEF